MTKVEEDCLWHARQMLATTHAANRKNTLDQLRSAEHIIKRMEQELADTGSSLSITGSIDAAISLLLTAKRYACENDAFTICLRNLPQKAGEAETWKGGA